METRGREVGEEPLTQIGSWMHQNYRQAMMLQVRTRGAEPSGEFLAVVRDAVEATAPQLPMLDPVWMTSMTANATLPQRIASTVRGAAGAMALLLAALGLHGVVAFGVSQRVPEIGLRMALGADRLAVFGIVLAGALRLIVAGMVVGIGIAVAAGRLVSDLLVGASPLDPLALGVPVVGPGPAPVLGRVRPARRAPPVAPGPPRCRPDPPGSSRFLSVPPGSARFLPVPVVGKWWASGGQVVGKWWASGGQVFCYAQENTRMASGTSPYIPVSCSIGVCTSLFRFVRHGLHVWMHRRRL